jgi:hypothetical protein
VVNKAGGPKKGRKSPESKFYDMLKGQWVRVVFRTGISALTAKLLWVDRYSLGLMDDGGSECLVMKSAVATVCLASRSESVKI